MKIQVVLSHDFDLNLMDGYCTISLATDIKIYHLINATSSSFTNKTIISELNLPINQVDDLLNRDSFNIGCSYRV